MRSNTLAALKVCDYQVAGHRGAEGKPGCLVDGSGRFYKPLQADERGAREAAFYERLRTALEAQAGLCLVAGTPVRAPGSNVEPGGSCGQKLESFCARNAVLLDAVPHYYGMVETKDGSFLELEDVAHAYRRPCIMDVKLGRRTWYPGADCSYIERCRARDAVTTQAALCFRICGMQVHQRAQGGVWRAGKQWCKALRQQDVPCALARFACCGGALGPADIYGGPRGAAAQLQRLERWFQEQREFLFYSASVLLVYEGDAGAAREASVSVHLIDFAHTFPSAGARDENCLQGVESLRRALCRAAAAGSEGP